MNIVLFVMLASLALFSVATHADTIALSTDGSANYTIVLAVNASDSERYAATELQSFLKQMSGADFALVKDGIKNPERSILVGRCKGTLSTISQKDLVSLGSDGFIIQSVGSDLMLVGGSQRGTMYACYSLLEDILGCRWYSSKVSVIPKRPTILIPAKLDRREMPAFENRDPFYADAFESDWAARNRSTSNSAQLDASRGGKIAYWPFVHSFYRLVPPEDYFAAHPEYYSLINGVRTHQGAQLCLTNPEVLEIATRKVFKWIEQHPEARIISVSQNDCINPCQCEKCQAIAKREGSEAGPLLEFVNAIADAVAARYPGKLIDTLAYQYTKEPPKTLKPRENVRVRLCPIEACVAHPFEKCEQNAVFVDLLHRWSRITKNLYVWHYVVNFHAFMQPFPNWREIAADIPMYHRNGVKGLMMQGDYMDGGNGEFAEMRAWVMAKMLWNPSRDFDKAMDDFLRGYYGPAASALREYLDMVNDNVEKNHIHVHIYDHQNAPYLTNDILTKSEALFKRAKVACGPASEYLRRVERDELALRYVRLCNAREDWGRNGSNAEVAAKLWKDTQKFASDYRSYGVIYISEGQRLDDWEKQWKKDLNQ